MEAILCMFNIVIIMVMAFATAFVVSSAFIICKHNEKSIAKRLKKSYENGYEDGFERSRKVSYENGYNDGYTDGRI